VSVLKIEPNPYIKSVCNTFMCVVIYMAYLTNTDIQRVKKLGYTNVCELPELGIGTSGGYIEPGEEI